MPVFVQLRMNMKVIGSLNVDTCSVYFNGEANNFKMELFNDIHEGSGGC